MMKIYCSKFLRHIKFQKPKISYIYSKELVLSTLCKASSNNDKLFKKENSIEIGKIFGLVNSVNE